MGYEWSWPWTKEKTKLQRAQEFVKEYQDIVIPIGIGMALLGLAHPRWWRRIPDADSIPVSYWKKQRFLTGKVTRVGDGDGFRFYHQVSD